MCSQFALFVDRHRVAYDNLAQHVVSIASSAASISSIEDVVDQVLAYDSHIMLFEDGALELQGVGDVKLLIAIGRESRALAHLLYELLLHAEMALARYVPFRTVKRSQLTWIH